MIVVTAATPWEARPFKKHWGLSSNGPQRSQGAVGEHPLVLLETGIGPENARKSLGSLDDFPGPLTVISSGFAGALQPGIRSGDLVADVREVPLEIVRAIRESSAAVDIPLHIGSFFSTDRVLADPAEKEAAGKRSRSVAVDMESAAVKDWCKARNETFLGIRVVLDALSQRLPRKAYAGTGSFKNLAGYAVRQWKEIPLLMSLGIRQHRAMSRLLWFMDVFLRKMEMVPPVE